MGPDESYRFAKGEAITTHNGMKARLKRPLDFLIIADHAFNMGLLVSIVKADPNLLNTASGKRLYEQGYNMLSNPDPVSRVNNITQFSHLNLWPSTGGKNSPYGATKKAIDGEIYTKSVWQKVTANADKFNVPGVFTAFIGFEWSSWGAPDDNTLMGNLHRNVVFKDGAQKANKILPFSAFDSLDPEDSWHFVELYQKNTGGDVIAIPHNGNVSNGQMFSHKNYEGSPLTQEYARKRSYWEPIYEVTQIKGDGETHPILSPDDQFADFETWKSWSGRTLEGVKKPGWTN